MFDRTNHYIGHESCFVFEQYIPGSEDEAFEINVDLPENFKKGVLRIKNEANVSKGQIIFWVITVIFICIYGFAVNS